MRIQGDSHFKKRTCVTRRRLLGTAASIGGALLAASVTWRSPAFGRAAPELKTVVPGKLTVALNGDMPMTSVLNGKLIGTDGEAIAAIAEKLGLEVNPALMDWSATIESIKSGRADVMLGNMAWTPKRVESLLLTDAIYYAGTFWTMRKDQPFSESVSTADLAGHSIGTVSGFSFVPTMKKIPGISELKLYDTTDACIRDVVAGRLDFALLDAPTIDYMILQNPSWNLKQVPVKPDPEFPQLSGKAPTVMGMNLENHDLFDAVNAGVKWLWKTQGNSGFLAKYGVSSPDYLIPPITDPRIGIDRDGNGNILGPGAHVAKDYSSYFS